MFTVVNLFFLSSLPTLTDFSAISLSSFLNSLWQQRFYQPHCVGITSSKSKSSQFLPYYPTCLGSSPFCSELWLFSGFSLENLFFYSCRFSLFACFKSQASLHGSDRSSICLHSLHVFQKFLKIMVHWRQSFLYPSETKSNLNFQIFFGRRWTCCKSSTFN